MIVVESRIIKLNDSFRFLMSTACFLLPMTTLADSPNLFPSDIIDQEEQKELVQKRSERFYSQRQWSFPEKTKNPPQYPPNQQYITIDGKPVQNGKTADYGNKKYPASDYYKGYQNNMSDQPVYDARQNVYYPNPGGTANGAIQNPAGQNPSVVETYGQPLHYPSQVDTAGGSADVGGAHYIPPAHGNLLFPSDVESRNKPKNKRFEPFAGDIEQRHQSGRNREEVRYVPVPVYNVPGTLPGTVPGMVTPSHMVPGYSHLNPYNSHYGMNSLPFVNPWNSYYSPFSSFGVPGGNPFTSFYNSNYNYFPFSGPGYLMPGLSMPDMFSSPGNYKNP